MAKTTDLLRKRMAEGATNVVRHGFLTIKLDKVSARNMIENSATLSFSICDEHGNCLVTMHEGTIREGETVYFRPSIEEMLRVDVI